MINDVEVKMISEGHKTTKRIGTDVVASPEISVVIPAYKVAEFITETLESCLAQTFGDREVIVVNDGSPDSEQLETAIAPFLERIVYINQTNTGVGEARNTAIEHSRGEFIAFLDGDDLWHPEFLASQLEFLTSGGYGMVYCNAELFGLPSVVGTTFMDQAPSNGAANVEALLDLRCNVITSGTFARKSVIEAAGMFESGREPSEDFHLWVRIAHSGSTIGY